MQDIVDILTPLITLVGFAVVIYNLNNSIKSNKRVDEKEIELRATAQAEMNITIREVSNDVKAIRAKLDSTEDDVNDLKTRTLMNESGIREIIKDNEKLHEEIKANKEEIKIVREEIMRK